MDDERARIWDIIDAARVTMLVTRLKRELRARPMEARPDRDAGQILFLTDIRGHKDDEIEAANEVALVVVDDKQKAYLSLTGHAEVLRDADLACRIWKKADDVWWPGGPHDEHVRVLRVTPLIAELWDGPASRAVAAHEFAKARATGEPPNLGEKRKVTVAMS